MRPLYCDESIWVPVADGLRRRGWIVHTARDEGTLSDPDREQLRYAVENDWLLLTFDDDSWLAHRIDAGDVERIDALPSESTHERQSYGNLPPRRSEPNNAD